MFHLRRLECCSLSNMVPFMVGMLSSWRQSAANFVRMCFWIHFPVCHMSWKQFPIFFANSSNEDLVQYFHFCLCFPKLQNSRKRIHNHLMKAKLSKKLLSFFECLFFFQNGIVLHTICLRHTTIFNIVIVTHDTILHCSFTVHEHYTTTHEDR